MEVTRQEEEEEFKKKNFQK